MSSVGLPGLSGVEAPSPHGNGVGPYSPTSRRRPTRPGYRHARAFPFMVPVSAPVGAKRFGAERAETCLRAELPSRSSTPRARPVVGVVGTARPERTRSSRASERTQAGSKVPNPERPGIRTKPSRAQIRTHLSCIKNPNEPEPVARDTNWDSLKSERTQAGSEPWTDAPLTSAGCRLGGFLCPEGTL
jgi:hypothetical protein